MELLFIAYFIALALIALFRDNADYIKHEFELANIPDSTIRILPTLEEVELEEVVECKGITVVNRYDNVIEVSFCIA